MEFRRLLLALIFACFGLALGGCPSATGVDDSSSEADDEEVSNLGGEIKIDGSSTVFPISEAAATKFRKVYPEVKVAVGSKGTGGGFKLFTQGDSDISDASRPIKQEEFEACKANGVNFIEIPIAYDGLTIAVNPKNEFVNELSVDQLKKLFLAGGAKTWKEVDESWPNREIKFFAPGTDSGTYDYFKEIVVGKDEAAQMRGDMSLSEDDSILVKGVSGEDNAIGFFGAAYYFKNKDRLKAVKIIDPVTSAAVEPTPETIESGKYHPFSRPLFIYVSTKSLDRLEVQEFVNFYVENAGPLSTEVGYVALPAELYQHALKNLSEENTGTHYLNAESKKPEGSLTEIFTAENLYDSK